MGGYTYCNQDKQVNSRQAHQRFLSSEDRPCRHSSYEVLDIEIDLEWETCGPAGCCQGENQNIPLYKLHEIPPFLSGNPYVVHGYRVLLPFSLCCKSIPENFAMLEMERRLRGWKVIHLRMPTPELENYIKDSAKAKKSLDKACLFGLFVWSNETVNIWSHIVGLVVIWLIMVYDNVNLIPEMGGSVADHAVLSLGLLCFQFSLASSAGYHLFHCHSERACRRWLALDLAGISVAILGCYLPAVYYAFYCLSLWKDVYLLVISVLFTVVLIFQTSPKYLSPHRSRQRLTLYIGLVVYGLIPTAHWISLQGGLDAHIVQIFIPKVAVMYLLGVMAFVFYISKFPERCFPGYFDFLGSSHQWWHVIVVTAFLWWRQAGLDILDYRLNQPCLPK